MPIEMQVFDSPVEKGFVAKGGPGGHGFDLVVAEFRVIVIGLGGFMSHPDNPLDPLRKAQEEDYFRKQNADLAAKLKARLSLKDAGIADADLAEALTRAGFNGDSVRALYLVPLFEVALVDRVIAPEEKLALQCYADERGLTAGSEARQLIERWIKSEGDDETYLRAKSLLDPLLNEIKKSADANWLVEAAQKVAAATGGLFGLGIGKTTSKAEAEVIAKLSQKLKKS